MNISAHIDRQDARLRQAADWLLRLNAPEVDEQVAAQWLEWCQSDPENLAAFERMRALWQRFDDKRLSERLAEDARAIPPDSIPHGRPSWRPNLRHLAAAATALLFTVGLSTWLVYRRGGEGAYTQVLRTDVASLHRESLPDGSRVELSARSTLRVRFTQDERGVVIEDGEAFFEVAKDPDRPFVVQAGALQVTAVGTAFNLRKSGTRVVVSVQEGIVHVVSSDPVPTVVGGSGPVEPQPESAKGQVRAGAGLQVIYSADEHTLTMAKVQPGAAAAWRSGRLEFVNEPLAAVVADLNRYSPRPITLEGGRTAAFVYTGTVRSDAIEDWLSAVEEVFPVQVVDRGASGIVIEDRPPY